MTRRLRFVDLDFVRAAPLRLVFAAEVSAPTAVVYRALAEEVEGSPGWFTAVTAARFTRAGAGREIRLKGGMVFHETIIAKESASGTRTGSMRPTHLVPAAQPQPLVGESRARAYRRLRAGRGR